VTLLPKAWPDWAQKIAISVGAFGAGSTIALTLVDKEHRLIVETMRGWGPGAFIALIAMLLCAAGFKSVMDMGGQMLQISRDGAAAQQNLADAVRELVNKDDREKEEQRRLLSYVGSQQEKILSAMEELKQASGKSRGASA
jgi:hypothetical protein